MKNAITLAFSILMLANSLSAQVFNDSPLLKQYDKESIFMESNRAYVKNGERLRVGFLYKKLEREMEVSPIAKMEYAKAKTSRNIARISELGFGVAYLGLIATDFGNGDNDILLWTAGVAALLTVNIIYTRKAYGQTQRAIWHRNRETLILVD